MYTHTHTPYQPKSPRVQIGQMDRKYVIFFVTLKNIHIRKQLLL